MTARLLLIACVLVAPSLVSVSRAHAEQARRFLFRYSFTVDNVPKGKPIRIWFPKPQSDRWQKVSVRKIDSPLPLRVTKDSTGRDETFFAESLHAGAAPYRFSITYAIERRPESASGASAPLGNAARQQYLQAATLVPVSGPPAEIAAGSVPAGSGTMQKAYALYRYVLTHMRYDKSGSGWGRGDAIFACNAHRGNCTDFHSLFLSMIRSQQIPARFDIGFAQPKDGESGTVPGYHCWAEFWDDSRGWVPVDISEAWQQPDLRVHNFGTIDASRVEFSKGRDIELTPRQSAGPLNYLIYPYVEVSGKPWTDVEKSFSFTSQ